jgi:hypothetical protein
MQVLKYVGRHGMANVEAHGEHQGIAGNETMNAATMPEGGQAVKCSLARWYNGRIVKRIGALERMNFCHEYICYRH